MLEVFIFCYCPSLPHRRGSKPYEEYHRALSEQVTTDFEFYYPLIESWLHVRAYPSADGLSVFFQDVTERKRVEESLAERERAARLGADVGLALTEGSDIRGMLQLCAEVVITGIRAGVAQGMVGLGVDLKDVATRRSLRDGIEFAEGLTGRRPARRS